MDAIFIAVGGKEEDFNKLTDKIRSFTKKNKLTWQIVTSSHPRSIFEGQQIGLAIGGNFTSKSFAVLKAKYTLTEPVDILRAIICCWCRKTCRLVICPLPSEYIWSHMSMCYCIQLKLKPGQAILLHNYNQPKMWSREWEFFFRGGEEDG